MKKKMITFILLAVLGPMLFSVLFTGCTTNNNTNNFADVTLEGFSHHETFELPTRHITALTLTLQNKGTSIAKNITLHIDIKDKNGNEEYFKEANLNSPLKHNEEILESIDALYDFNDKQLGVDISINWDGGTNHYSWSFEPKLKVYADVMLESMTHHERYDLLNGYTTSVNFLIQNRGNLIANNVKIHVIVKDNLGNKNYDNEESVISFLMPWEVESYNITVPYDFDDTLLNLSITVIWNGGINHYNRSFKPEFKDYADVRLDSMTHYEHYILFAGYESTVTFILQNKGNGTADNVKIYIIAQDNDGNEEYNSETTVTSSLITGEIKSQEIIIPFDFDDTHLNLSITITWDGGLNNYSKSFEPKIFF